eukprot:jgi/Mesvir1/23943/Mv10714-RA.1
MAAASLTKQFVGLGVISLEPKHSPAHPTGSQSKRGGSRKVKCELGGWACRSPRLDPCRPNSASFVRNSPSIEDRERFSRFDFSAATSSKGAYDAETVEPGFDLANDDDWKAFLEDFDDDEDSEEEDEDDEEDDSVEGADIGFDEDDELQDDRRKVNKKMTRAMRRRLRTGERWEVPEHLLPLVAIVGRPNVGKSALFNRIVGAPEAIVHDEAGVTRDRLYRRAFWGAREFMVVDTGGLTNITAAQAATLGGGPQGAGANRGDEAALAAAAEAARVGMPELISRQVAAAVADASVVLHVTDGQSGICANDYEVSSWLRKHYPNKKVLLCVNKCESATQGVTQAQEFWKLGLEPLPVSAISGTGTGEVLDLVVAALPPVPDLSTKPPAEDDPLRISIIGRPNVGKSSILNYLVGEERAIVSPVRGTTRDAIDTNFVGEDGQKYILVDTAGVRKRAAIKAANSFTEQASVTRAFRAIQRSDVVLLVLDASEGVAEQDFRLAEKVEAEGKACVIVMNKWDTVADKDGNTINKYEASTRERLRNLDWAPMVFTSAASGQRVPKLLEVATQVGRMHRKRVPTATLNMVIGDATMLTLPPVASGKRGKIMYTTQVAARPPTFIFFVNEPKAFTPAYARFLERQLREQVGFEGTPLRLFFRGKGKKPEWLLKKDKP